MKEESHEKRLTRYNRAIQKITADLAACHVRAVVMFGSMARYLAGSVDHFPRDIDLLVAGDNTPFSFRDHDYGVRFELHHFRLEELEAVARCLRYDPRPAALVKLYVKNVAKSHARDIIAACLLLGPGYRDYGIEQIEIDGRPDPRDYSLHRVLYGRRWWKFLTAYANERRDFAARWGDRLAGRYRFQEWLRAQR